MNEKVRQLTVSVRATVTLLLTAATLIVIGIFNEALNWDIFGPKVEAVLYGVFYSSIALAIIGVAMTFVLGIREIVHSFQAIEKVSTGSKEELVEVSNRTYVKYLLWPLVLLLGIIITFAGANYFVQDHRAGVFKRIAAGQMKQFNSKLAQVLSLMAVPPRNNVPPDLHDMLKSMKNLSYIQEVALYLPDPNDVAVMWRYTTSGEYERENGFEKFFVAKNFEKAMAEALRGSEGNLREINDRRDFIWYYLVKDPMGKAIGVIRIDGNTRENFREYMLGS